MGKAAGVSHAYLAIASILEIAGLVSAALSNSLIDRNALFQHYYPLSWLPIITPLVLLAYLFTPWLFHKIRPTLDLISPISMLTPFFYHLLFFLISGLALALLGILTGNINLRPDSALILNSFAIAWSIGFITPGAPPGIGIREALLLQLLTPLSGALH
ncbi:MAG: hypothetical protein KZQ86_05800 [Candidatus Thiodiazotropha sp. (ex Lucinoma kastoroae)]|nr:hypothetical protein [Candidatus Thiodiazotropha sp. (ex Lucinoma kastoroae)]